MTREDIDTLWQQALQESVKAGEQFTRYHFAALVADAEAKRIHTEGMVTVGHMREQIAAERKACAQLLRDNAAQCTKGSMNEYILTSNAQAIEARGQA